MNHSLYWTDMHVHLDKLEEGAEKAIQFAKDSGVQRLVTIGTEPEDLPTIIKLCDQFGPNVFGTLGIHPHEGVKYTSKIGEFIRKNASHPKIIAIGEIGLDYYYLQSSKDEQLAAFREQLEIAAELKMPVEIHTRDAEDDTISLLTDFKDKVKGIIHCFTGTQRLADACLDLGYNISISGIVTFKNADELRNVVKSIPISRIHVETDAPFLTPVPMRGRPNTPGYVVHTAHFIAKMLGVSVEDFCLQTNKNAETMFPKLITGVA